MTKEDWQQKSGEELITASGQLGYYPVNEQKMLLAELQRRQIRQLPESESTVKTLLSERPLLGALRQTQTLSNRYWDAYLVAKVTIGIGKTIKIIGFVLAAINLLGTVYFASLASGFGNNTSGGVFILAFAIGGLYALIIGFVFYVIGVFISSQGQVLIATLDNTVGNSPFLTDSLKAKIMSIPEA